MGARILLTGATGFVGKVVLSELLRRRDELDIEKILLVIRRQGTITSASRFKKVASAPCFAHLKPGWRELCEVVEADLAEKDALAAYQPEVPITQIIHCAASVEFNLPVASAARSNITASLNVLAFARHCHSLQRMVSVSTAYVTPHRDATTPVREKLVKLPRPAAALYEEMRASNGDAKADLRLRDETGHPNTYTLTKCVAEHLLFQERGQVPLTIIRPSIVSACRTRPFAGWIDSRAALAGFVALIGLGHLRAVVVDPQSRLDVVPCDDVAERIIAAAFEQESRPTVIRHAVAGIEHANAIETCCQIIVSHYRRNPIERRAVLHYKGPANARFHLHDVLHHRAPLTGAQLGATVTRSKRMAKAAKKLHATIQELHRAFPYFTEKTFNFVTSVPLPDDFPREEYIDVVCGGVARHLLGRDPRRTALAGRKHKAKSDLMFAFAQPRGNATVRSLSLLVRKGLRRCVDGVTFDKPSFEAAMKQVPRDALVVIVPTHRSYLDFLLCPLLFFTQPGLGIAPPKIAAAEEFSRIPIVGNILERAGAFYIKRGLGKASHELNYKVRRLVDDRETLMFFIEGKRSRDRRFVEPRTGLLRAIQSTGRKTVILPVAISYDRVPEEASLLAELRSGIKPPMHLKPLLGWMARVAREQVSLGNIHLSCGRPVNLTPESNVKRVARSVMGQLQARTVTTTHHLRAFLENTGIPGMDLEWLTQAIVSRGGEVVESELPVEVDLDPLAEETLRRNWMHLFYPDALAMFWDRPGVVAAIEREHFRDGMFTIESKESTDPRLEALLCTLFDQPRLRGRAVAVSAVGKVKIKSGQRSVATRAAFRRSVGRRRR